MRVGVMRKETSGCSSNVAVLLTMPKVLTTRLILSSDPSSDLFNSNIICPSVQSRLESAFAECNQNALIYVCRLSHLSVARTLNAVWAAERLPCSVVSDSPKTPCIASPVAHEHNLNFRVMLSHVRWSDHIVRSFNSSTVHHSPDESRDATPK